jgi:hypothetical protein
MPIDEIRIEAVHAYNSVGGYDDLASGAGLVGTGQGRPPVKFEIGA